MKLICKGIPLGTSGQWRCMQVGLSCYGGLGEHTEWKVVATNLQSVFKTKCMKFFTISRWYSHSPGDKEKSVSLLQAMVWWMEIPIYRKWYEQANKHMSCSNHPKKRRCRESFGELAELEAHASCPYDGSNPSYILMQPIPLKSSRIRAFRAESNYLFIYTWCGP